MYIRNPETNEWEEVFLPPTGDTFPIGMYGWFAGENAPTNWLRCDGQAVSRTEYKDLFDAIGTTYGAGDGSTTFNLPNVNLENRTLVGSSGDGEFSVGNTGGEKEHALTSAENGPHTHNLGYDYLGFRRGTTSGIDSSQLGAWTLSSKQTTSSGNGTPHNNMQPYMASVCCIKAKQSAGIIGDVTTDIHDTNENAVPNANTVKSYVDEKTNEIVLYENDTGSNGTITLKDNLSKYSYIEIFYRSNDGWVESKKIYKPNNKYTTLMSFTGMTNSAVYVKFNVIKMSETSIAPSENRYREFLLADSGIGSWKAENYIFITRVIGYK